MSKIRIGDIVRYSNGETAIVVSVPLAETEPSWVGVRFPLSWGRLGGEVEWKIWSEHLEVVGHVKE